MTMTVFDAFQFVHPDDIGSKFVTDMEFQVRGYLGGSRIKGRWVNNPEAELVTIMGHIQPLSTESMQNLEINQRKHGGITVWTDLIKLNHRDVILWEGEEYAIDIRSPWIVNSSLDHYEFIALMVIQGEDH